MSNSACLLFHIIWLISRLFRLWGSFKRASTVACCCQGSVICRSFPTLCIGSFTLMRLTQLSTGPSSSEAMPSPWQVYFTHNPITLLASLLLADVRSICQSRYYNPASYWAKRFQFDSWNQTYFGLQMHISWILYETKGCPQRVYIQLESFMFNMNIYI